MMATFVSRGREAPPSLRQPELAVLPSSSRVAIFASLGPEKTPLNLRRPEVAVISLSSLVANFVSLGRKEAT